MLTTFLNITTHSIPMQKLSEVVKDGIRTHMVRKFPNLPGIKRIGERLVVPDSLNKIDEKIKNPELFLKRISRIAMTISGLNNNSLLEQIEEDRGFMPMFFVDDVIKNIEENSLLIPQILELISRSDDPMNYTKFLSRRNMKKDNINRFVDSSSFFAGDRIPVFEPVNENEIKRTRDMLEIAKNGDVKDLILHIYKELKDIHEREDNPDEMINIIESDVVEIAYTFLHNSPKKREELENLIRNHELHKLFELTGSEVNYFYENFEEMALGDTPLGHPTSGYPIVYSEEYGPLVYCGKFDKFGLMGYKSYDPNVLSEQDVSGYALGKHLVVNSEKDSTVQHELQHTFNSIIALDLSEKDDEYAAYLASIAFSENPIKDFSIILSYVDQVLDEEDNGLLNDNHFLAQNLIIRNIGRYFKIPILAGQIFDMLGLHTEKSIQNEILASLRYRLKIQSKSAEEGLRDYVRLLLNKFYVKRVGISYDGMLEPFKK